MSQILTDKSRYHVALGIFVALAFLVQSFMPSGYMPLIGSGKIFELTICHGNDIATIFVDEHMKPVTGANDTQKDTKKSGIGDKSCPFSSVSSKNLALASFLYQFTEKLTYERAAERNLAPHFSHIAPSPYDGRAPPQSLA